MTIDLGRFAQPEIVVMPLIDGWGSVNARKLYFNKRGKKYRDGWYEVLLGDDPSLIKLASPLQVRKIISNRKSYSMYPFGVEGIPVNADNFKKRGFPESVTVYFMDARPFQIIDVVPWECGRFFFKGFTLQGGGDVFKKIGERFENEQSLNGISGITPEMRYYFLILNLQRQSVREAAELEKFALSEKEREKRLVEFQNTFSGRLQLTVESAGGKLIKWEKRGENFLVIWSAGGQEIKSIIKDTMRVISAGFCVSSYDTFHTLNSLPHLLQIYQDEGSVVVTRN